MSDTQALSAPLLWGSVVDVKNLEVSPILAANTLYRIFGARAVIIVAWCAIQARQDGDEPSYRLWLSAFKDLKAPEFKVQP